jgi:hypothetical protein
VGISPCTWLPATRNFRHDKEIITFASPTITNGQSHATVIAGAQTSLFVDHFALMNTQKVSQIDYEHDTLVIG